MMREGSFSAAANRLNLSQPAVNQQFRQLEHYFGVRLAERSGNGIGQYRGYQGNGAGRAGMQHRTKTVVEL
ncbi:LysR family transcriptional regulator [Dickeya chrysanthemi]|nr:LysR family transcriptional regulator [Dickeya chrysanthemi]